MPDLRFSCCGHLAVGTMTLKLPLTQSGGLCEWGSGSCIRKSKNWCYPEDTKALFIPLIRFGEEVNLYNGTNMKLNAKARRLCMAGSLQRSLERHNPLLIILLNLLGSGASTWAAGSNAQPRAMIDPSSNICSCMCAFQKPPNSIPQTATVESSGRGQINLRLFMFDALLWIWEDVWHSWHWMSWGQLDRGQ
jgi:hypothetical protein